jgi:Nucleoside permease
MAGRLCVDSGHTLIIDSLTNELFVILTNLQVPWKIVIWGVIMQLAIGLVTIRLSLGRYVLECIGHHVQTFLEFAYQGAAFVYGDEIVFVYHVFAFKVSIDFVQVPNVIY